MNPCTRLSFPSIYNLEVLHKVGGFTRMHAGRADNGADGNSDLFAFSTGRRAVSSLHTVFTFRPRHDFFQYAYQVIRGFIELDWKVVDEVDLDFTFQDNPNIPDCVWAIVAKDELKRIKESRWDLVSRQLASYKGRRSFFYRVSRALQIILVSQRH